MLNKILICFNYYNSKSIYILFNEKILEKVFVTSKDFLTSNLTSKMDSRFLLVTLLLRFFVTSKNDENSY